MGADNFGPIESKQEANLNQNEGGQFLPHNMNGYLVFI